MPERMSPEVFRDALCSHKHTLPQLRRKLERAPVRQRAEALLPVFCDQTRPDAAYRDQEMAGRFLVALAPEPRRSLEEILWAVAPSWNVSVEQLPHYLSDVFGREAVVEAAQRLAGEFAPESREARASVTVIWWLSGKGGNGEGGIPAPAGPSRTV